MGKSKNSRDYWDNEGVGRTYEAMDRRDARKQKGRKKDPEAEVVEPFVNVYPDFNRRR